MIFLLFCRDLKHVMKYFHYLCKEMCTETHPFALSVLVFYPFFLKERAANQLFRELKNSSNCIYYNSNKEKSKS